MLHSATGDTQFYFRWNIKMADPAPSFGDSQSENEKLRQRKRWEDFLASLPTTFPLLGYAVTIYRRKDGELALKVDTRSLSAEVLAKSKAVDVFVAGKGEQIQRQFEPELSEYDDETIKQEFAAFFKFFLRTPIGPVITIFGPSAFVNQSSCELIRKAFRAWRCLNSARDKHGRLKEAMTCTAFRSSLGNEFATCTARTKDPSGLCHVHNGQFAKTIFNHNPIEKFANRLHEMAVTDAELAKLTQERKEMEADREAKISLERIRREEKWKDVAFTINCTASKSQLYLLLDLGAAPEELNGISIQEASSMIRDLLYPSMP